MIGINGLRVADASIMPVITNANIQAAVFMIAEKQSDEIKTYWGLGVPAPDKSRFTYP